MSFPRYPAYKPSGVEWLGEVPEHWNLVPIKRILQSIEQGWSPQCEAAPAELGEWGVLKVGCVNGGKFNPDENKALPRELLPDERLAIRSGDVLVSRANTRELVGSVAMAEMDYPNILLCDKLYRLRTSQAACCPAFLARYLVSDGARNVIEKSASGTSSSMLNIGQSVIVNMPIALPSAREQADVVHFLDRETAKIDALIAEQQRLIELLQEKRQAVISHVVTKGLNPDAPMKDSGVEWLGEVPEHWEVTPLKHLATVQTGMAKGKDLEGIETVDVPYLRVANVQDGYLILDEVHLLSVPATSLDRYLLKEGDVLMNEGGDFDKLGRGCIWQGEIEPCVHQNHVFAVRPHSVSGEWLNAYTTAKAANLYFISRSKQSTNLASISSSNLMGLSVPLPPVEEARETLERMNKLVKVIDDLKHSATQAIDLLQERRSAMISAAVTGQIDVRGLVPEASAA